MYKVVWVYQLAGGQTAQNVWFVALDGDSPFEDVINNEYLDWLVAQVWSLLKLVTVAAVRLISIEMFKWTEEGFVPSTVRVVNEPGNVSQDAVPPAVAMLVQIGRTSAGKKGSKYLPGFNEGSWLSSVWSSTALVTAGVAMLKMATPQSLGGANDVNWNHGIMKIFEGVGAFDFDPFASYVIADAEPGNQRRRRKGVGI